MPAPETRFRSAFQISSEMIAHFTDVNLTSLMRELLRAHAYLCGADPSKVCVNAEEKAADGGCDAWTPKPSLPDGWFGDANTCWQLKSGTAGQPSALRGEVTKPVVAETLRAGGRFVVVASGCTAGHTGEEKRRDILKEEASAAGLPIDRIDVIGCDRLTTWVNQIPSVAMPLAGRPGGFWNLDEWLASNDHQGPWSGTTELDAAILQCRDVLDFSSRNNVHIHVHGQPGVGKSRFVLEVCRQAPWRAFVVYLRQSGDVSLRSIVDEARLDKGVRMVIVADEARKSDLGPLHDAVALADGRIRLVTIGHARASNPTQIPEFEIRPIDESSMATLIEASHPSLPPEHVRFVAHLSDGYVKFARLAANAIVANPKVDVHALLNQAHIREMLSAMLGDTEYRYLHVPAVLTVVGWRNEVAEEGRVISEHLDLEWAAVRASVERCHDRHGIVPSGGRYRYISPLPLAIFLAIDAWRTFPDKMQSLPEKLPTDTARAAYFDRLRDIASNPEARALADEQLRFFFRVDSFADYWSVKRWSALSYSRPGLAAANARRAFQAATTEQRLGLSGAVRREIVSALVRLASQFESFFDATVALGVLAEAENETWGNNASGEFVCRFKVHLGGTSVAYQDRMVVLDSLHERGSAAIDSLIVKALALVGSSHESSTIVESGTVAPPEPEWHPANDAEDDACRSLALRRLERLAREARPELVASLEQAVSAVQYLLRGSLRKQVIEFYASVSDAYPNLREAVRSVIAEVRRRDVKYAVSPLPEDYLREIEEAERRFTDATLATDLRRLLGVSPWESDATPDLKKLAQDLRRDTATLAGMWHWITSGEAHGAWRLGEALAETDDLGVFGEFLLALKPCGRDARAIAGYLNTQKRRLGDCWFDAWIDANLVRVEKHLGLLMDLTWRIGATAQSLAKLVDWIRNPASEIATAGQLSSGNWFEAVPTDSIAALLDALVSRGGLSSAVAILDARLEKVASDKHPLEPQALRIVCDPSVIRSRGMDGFHWNRIVRMLLPQHARAVTAAILSAARSRERSGCLSEHSDSRAILSSCVEIDPTMFWDELMPYLSNGVATKLFCVGFPRGLVDKVPAKAIDEWIDGDPPARAAIVADVATKDFGDDQSLAARVVGRLGDDPVVAAAFFRNYISGVFMGPASMHWRALSHGLRQVAAKTSLPKLRHWASDSARSFDAMADREEEREAEERARGE
jgi:hypothetical protein